MAEQVIPQTELMGEASASLQMTPIRNGRGFLIERTWRPNLETPTDELTGLPLPLLPSELNYQTDLHHHFHSKRNPELQGLAGLALRNARLQKADYNTHHYYYHATYTGPSLPSTDDGKFALVIMAVAGYMPNEAIDFYKGEPRRVPLEYDARRQLQTSGEIRLGSRDAVQRFIRSYVLEQDIDAVNASESMLDEFLHTKNIMRRLDLGHNLLGLITDKATEHVQETYRLARQRELIMPGVAMDVRKFTKAALGPRKKRDNLVGMLREKLAA